MKTIALGDIHGRYCWWDIIDKENPDRIIFMGDYVSTHDKDIDTTRQCSNLEDILNYKEANPDKVILLRGNHDMQHLGYAWAECSGYFPHVAKWMVENRDRFLELSQWVHIQDNMVFSHAGISQDFWNYLNLGEPTEDNILKINELEPSPLFGFTPNRISDYYGDSTTQPLTWIRPGTLIENNIGWIQVVGHTRIKTPGPILKYMKEKPDFVTIPELWCIDALPSWYMVIEDGECRMEKNEKAYGCCI